MLKLQEDKPTLIDRSSIWKQMRNFYHRYYKRYRYQISFEGFAFLKNSRVHHVILLVLIDFIELQVPVHRRPSKE